MWIKGGIEVVIYSEKLDAKDSIRARCAEFMSMACHALSSGDTTHRYVSLASGHELSIQITVPIGYTLQRNKALRVRIAHGVRPMLDSYVFIVDANSVPVRGAEAALRLQGHNNSRRTASIEKVPETIKEQHTIEHLATMKTVALYRTPQELDNLLQLGEYLVEKNDMLRAGSHGSLQVHIELVDINHASQRQMAPLRAESDRRAKRPDESHKRAGIISAIRHSKMGSSDDIVGDQLPQDIIPYTRPKVVLLKKVGTCVFHHREPDIFDKIKNDPKQDFRLATDGDGVRVVLRNEPGFERYPVHPDRRANIGTVQMVDPAVYGTEESESDEDTDADAVARTPNAVMLEAAEELGRGVEHIESAQKLSGCSPGLDSIPPGPSEVLVDAVLKRKDTIETIEQGSRTDRTASEGREQLQEGKHDFTGADELEISVENELSHDDAEEDVEELRELAGLLKLARDQQQEEQHLANLKQKCENGIKSREAALVKLRAEVGALQLQEQGSQARFGGELAALASDREKLRARMDGCSEESLAAKKRENEILQLRSNDLERQHAQEDNRKQELLKKNRDLSDELVEVARENADAERTFKHQDADLGRRKEKLRRREEELASAERDLADKEARLVDSESIVKQQRQKLAERTLLLRELDGERASMRIRLDNAHRQVAEEDVLLRSDKKQLEDATQRVEALRTERVAAAQAVQAKNAQYDEEKLKLEEDKKQLGQLEANYQKQKQSVDRKRKYLAAIENIQESSPLKRQYAGTGARK